MDFLTRMANSVMRIYLATPRPFRWIYWLIPVAYFILPIDFDRLGLLGRIDDIAVMLFCYWAFDRAKQFTSFYREAKAEGKQQTNGTDTSSVRDPLEGKGPFQVLGLAESATSTEIKSAYRRLLSLYHPDKFSHLGAEFEHTAQRRTRAIIAAYERLKSR